MFDVAGLSAFSKDGFEISPLYFIAFLNSNVCQYYLEAMSPTLNYETGQISNLPVILKNTEELSKIAKENVDMAKRNWDSFEISWDFKKHPLL